MQSQNHRSREGIVENIRRSSKPFQPIPTGMEAKLLRMEGIKALLFDVYGTLILSGAGDISLVKEKASEAQPEVGELIRRNLSSNNPRIEGIRSDHFFSAIQKERELLKASGTEHPEVDVREIWTALIGSAAPDLNPDPSKIEAIAAEYECLVNPVWPEPGALQLLNWAKEKALLLGIVSNAQFFTPLLFDALLGKSLDDLGFSVDLCFWSYQHRIGKPSTYLFELAAKAFAEETVEPTEVLYIGNDLRNDILPAQRTGFRTALYAGDERSLRLREDDPSCASTQSDAILTSLSQIAHLVG